MLLRVLGMICIGRIIWSKHAEFAVGSEATAVYSNLPVCNHIKNILDLICAIVLIVP